MWVTMNETPKHEKYIRKKIVHILKVGQETNSCIYTKISKFNVLNSFTMSYTKYKS